MALDDYERWEKQISFSGKRHLVKERFTTPRIRDGPNVLGMCGTRYKAGSVFDSGVPAWCVKCWRILDAAKVKHLEAKRRERQFLDRVRDKAKALSLDNSSDTGQFGGYGLAWDDSDDGSAKKEAPPARVQKSSSQLN